MLAYTAATQPAVPTGFWDRTPRPPSGRLRHVLAGVHCEALQELPEPLRKKVTNHAHAYKRLWTSQAERSYAHVL